MYVEVEQGLRDSPKTIKAARNLGISLPVMVGHLVWLWLWCIDHAPEGNLGGYEDEVIASAAGWEGDSDKFVRVLIEARKRPTGHGFLEVLEQDGERSLCIHDWEEHAGGIIKWRQRRAEMAREARVKTKPAEPEEAAKPVPRQAKPQRQTREAAIESLVGQGYSRAALDDIASRATGVENWYPYLEAAVKKAAKAEPASAAASAPATRAPERAPSSPGEGASGMRAGVLTALRNFRAQHPEVQFPDNVEQLPGQKILAIVAEAQAALRAAE